MNNHIVRSGGVTVERHNSKALGQRQTKIRAQLRRECKHCGKPLPENCRKDKQTCDDRCRKAWERRDRPRAHRSFETRSCRWCLSEFEARSDSRKRYCKHACTQAAWRAKNENGRQGDLFLDAPAPLVKRPDDIGVWG